MTHSERMCVCLYRKSSKHTRVEPHSQDVSSLTYTHRSNADSSLYALAPSLSGGVQRGPGRPQCSALAIWSTLGLGGILDPPAVAGWMGGPAQRSPFQQPSMIDRRPHSLTPAAATTHCDQNTHATTSTTSKTMTRVCLTVTR